MATYANPLASYSVLAANYEVQGGAQQTIGFETGVETYNDLREFAEAAINALDDESL